MLFAVRSSLYHLTKTTLFEKKSYFLLRCGGWTVKKARIRQNSVFFRLMDFGKWVNSGVVNFTVFGISKQISDYCKKVMQVLTGQYPQLYFRKFRVFYTDFQPNATRRSTIPLFTMPKAHQVVNVGFWTESQFLDGVGSDIAVALWDTNNQAAIGVATGNYSNYRVSLPSTSTNGSWVGPIVRTKPTTPTSQSLWSGFTAPTPIGLSVTMPTGRTVNQLTAGIVLVWVGYIKLT